MNDNIVFDGGHGNNSDQGDSHAAQVASRISPVHLADLRDSSGLSDATILANYYRNLGSVAVGHYLCRGKTFAEQRGDCLAIPFFNRDGTPMVCLDRETGTPIIGKDGKPIPYVRFKPLAANRCIRKGKPCKYESPDKVRNHAYFPVYTRAMLADPTIPVIITEGEKKAARADQDGYACIGLVGVEGWGAPRPKDANGRAVGERKLMDDLAAIPWTGRVAFICYDSDAIHKPEIRRAEIALAKALHAHGVQVRVVRLPELPGGSKCGLDDFLKANGKEAFDALLAGARNLVLYGGAVEGCNSGDANSFLCSPSPHLKTKFLARCDRCPPLDFLGAADWNQNSAGRFGPPCKKRSDCPACLASFKHDCNWLGRLVAASTRPVSVCRIPNARWKRLADHLDRLQAEGTSRSHIVVRQTLTSEAYVFFLGAPESSRLTRKSAPEAATELTAAIEGIELCDLPSGKRWRPVRTSEDLKRPKEEKKKTGQWKRMPPMGWMSDAALRTIFRRYSAIDAKTLPAQWRVLVNGPRDRLVEALDEARRGHLAMRYIPHDPGFSGLDDLWDWMLTGEPPSDLPPLNEMPTDPSEICGRIESLIPGLGQKAWEIRDEEDIREILRGAIRWARTHPRPTVAVAPDTLPGGELPDSVEGVVAAILALDPARADLADAVRAGAGLDAAHDLFLAFVGERERAAHPAPAEPAPPAPGLPPTGPAIDTARELLTPKPIPSASPPDPIPVTSGTAHATDTAFVDLCTEARRLAADLSPKSRVAVELGIARRDPDSLRRLVAGLRQIAALRPPGREAG